jgi:predicted PurR-regulated permease PerM
MTEPLNPQSDVTQDDRLWSLLSYILIILVTYTQGSSTLSLSPAVLTVLVWLVIMAINQVIRLVIFPKLVGKSAHLPVFLVILGLVVAAVLWGVIGVILVIPLLGTMGEVLKYVLSKINREDPYPGEELRPGFWAREMERQNRDLAHEG